MEQWVDLIQGEEAYLYSLLDKAKEGKISLALLATSEAG